MGLRVNADGTVCFAASRRLTQKQRAALKLLSGRNAEAYLHTLLGMQRGHTYVPRMRSDDIDALQAKCEGSVLRALQHAQNVDQTHKPTAADVGHWIGVEVECFLPTTDEIDGETVTVTERDARRRLREALKARGVSRCSLKHDGSLSSDDPAYPIEVTLLFNAKRGFDQLQAMCAALRDCGAFVNRTCGLHVHLDSRHRSQREVKRIGARIGRTLPVLQYLVPESRRTNQYCRLKVSALNGSRYCAVNLTAFAKYKTIEVRLHSGTTSYAKIKNWIQLLQHISSVLVPRDLETFQDLLDLGISDALTEYVTERLVECSPHMWDVWNAVPAPAVPAVSEFPYLQAYLAASQQAGA